MSDTKALTLYLKPRLDKLAKWCTAGMEAEDLARFAMLEFAHNKKLQACSPESIYLSLIAAARLGLKPDGVDGAIIPYGTNASFIPMYQGKARLAIESGYVLDIFSAAVFENDTYKVTLGSNPNITHEIDNEDRGAVVGAYAIAALASGGHRFEVITKDQLASIKAKGAANSPAWKEFEDEMARKSAVNRLCKTLPKTAKMTMAQKLDDCAITGDVAGYRNILDIESD